jgi:tetratricopeptide (TPR) repeat protein
MGTKEDDMNQYVAAKLSIVILAAAVAGCAAARGKAPPAPEEPARRPAPLFSDLGSHHHPITTGSQMAQRYFDQGLTLAYGFNHAEAVRSFEACIAHDRAAAMCHWGKAFALGPNINAPMPAENVAPAWEALDQAKRHARGASKQERAYIDALATRYEKDPPEDRSRLDRDFADAMRKVADEFPDDLDARTLAAEAAMNTIPWDYYLPDGKAKPLANEIVAMLESVLARDPNHIGAIHFYIHAVEASSTPERAEPYADRLADLCPGAGHLVHMPSHIYYRVGRYNDATEINVRAAKADESYITQCKAQGFYPAMYYPHNVHFLLASAMEEGRSELAIANAKKLYDLMSDEQFEEYPILEEFRPIYWYTLARFGKWQEILEQPPPKETLRFSRAMRHYVRGRAYVGLGKSREAEQELRALREIADDPDLTELRMQSGSTAAQLLGIARHVLAASLWQQRGRTDAAASDLKMAIAIQDALPYTEPPPWYFPVRLQLGALLLRARRFAEAEEVYRAALDKNRENGWALYGLAASQRALGQAQAASETQARFARAWARADVEPTLTYR